MSPVRRPYVESLHLTDSLLQSSQGHATGRLTVECCQQQSTRRRRVPAGQAGELFRESLELQIDTERLGIFLEESLYDGNRTFVQGRDDDRLHPGTVHRANPGISRPSSAAC